MASTGNRVSRAELGAWLRPEANLNLVFLPIGLGYCCTGVELRTPHRTKARKPTANTPVLATTTTNMVTIAFMQKGHPAPSQPLSHSFSDGYTFLLLYCKGVFFVFRE